MHVPLCEYETHHHEWVDFAGRTKCDAVAMIRPCGHSHRYLDFEATLNRLYPKLHLGWDRITNRWCIYCWTLELSKVKAGNDLPTLNYGHRFLDILIDCAWVKDERTAEGGTRRKHIPREYGNWIL